MNILILSVGRRVELVKAFKEARDRLKIKGNIVGVDLSKLAPAIYFADKHYLLDKIGTINYIPKLIEICNKEEIDLIVPTIDTELLILAEYRKEIEESTKAKILLSNDYTIQTCRDKFNTQRFFEENNFLVPRLLTNEDVENGKYEFPLFIKPKDGSSSINTFKVKNKKELDFFLDYIKYPMIQEFIEGEEYSIDAFCDFDSNPITIVPRLRIATRSGEIAKGKVIKDIELIEETKKIIEILKPIGHIIIQCMKTKRGIEYIEINPRFGGGTPMSIAAGADSCEFLYRLFRGEKLVYNEDYKDNSVFLRFDSSIMIEV